MRGEYKVPGGKLVARYEMEYPTVAVAGSPLAAPAAARAGVFVIAPANVPAIRAGSMAKARPVATATPAPTTKTATIAPTTPALVRITWKKLGPDVIPMAKAKSARPRTPTSWGTRRSWPLC